MKNIATNKKAFHDYEILEKFQAGIVLYGSEVKSLRQGRINISEAYARIYNGEAFVQNLHITPYEHLSFGTLEPLRKRKLLLHKQEIAHLSMEVDRKKLTLIPLSIFFEKQWVKVELALCRGKTKYDKRQKIAAEENKKQLANLRNRMREQH